MAKPKDIGFIDQHIEKVLFVLCLLVAGFMIIHYGLSSPRVIDILGQKVSPKEVDQTILSKAKNAESRVEAAPPLTVKIKDYLTAVENQITQPLPAKLTSANFGVAASKGPKGGRNTIRGSVSIKEIIAAMPKPTAPLGWAGVELFVKKQGVGRGSLKLQDIHATLTLRAASVYPTGGLRKAWKKILQKTIVIPQVVPIGYEVQLEEVFSNDSTRTIEKFTQERLPAYDENGQRFATPKVPVFDGQNSKEVRTRVSMLLDNGWSAYELQPRYYDVWTHDGRASWQAHLPVDALLKYFPQKTPEDIRPEPGIEGGVPTAPAAFAPGEALGSPTPELVISVQPGKELKKEKPLVLPNFKDPISAGKMLVWFHTNDIQLGKRYRCRIRVIFANPLLTYPEAVTLGWQSGQELPADSVTPTVASPWSIWSAPMGVNKETFFFLTGANPAGRKVSVTMFTTELGQWVRRDLSSIQVGQPLQEQATIKIRNPLKMGAIPARTRGVDVSAGEEEDDDSFIERRVNFDTGAIVVDLRFDKEIWLSADRSKNNGVEMVYQDAQGQLHRRILYLDKNNPEYKEYLKKAKEFAPARRVRRPRDTDSAKDKRDRERERDIRNRNRLTPPRNLDQDRFSPDNIRSPRIRNR